MNTFFWILLKTIQGLGLITVISGLYWGIRNHDMNYEVQMLIYGTIMLYGPAFILNKYFK
mgnify:CR=1 FL=1|jgi:hypothetical protein|tara:strand:- start:1672 stop:1851 length:180 start_codon:yes stop_codon:yes gene_type:complete